MKLYIYTNFNPAKINFIYIIYFSWIKVSSRELKGVDHLEYLGSVLTKGGYYTVEIKTRFA